MKEELLSEEESKERIVKRKPIKCPVCGFKPVATILYGYPCFSPELQKEIEEGKTTLGGCDTSPGQPRWECTNCGTKFCLEEKFDLEDKK